MSGYMIACMECGGCGHRWVAVAPSPCAADAECPQCHEMKGHQNRERTEMALANMAYQRGNTILIEALMDMVNQFFGHYSADGKPDQGDGAPPDLICHSFMSAEEAAIDVLEQAGFAELVSEKPLRWRLLWDKLEERKALENQ